MNHAFERRFALDLDGVLFDLLGHPLLERGGILLRLRRQHNITILPEDIITHDLGHLTGIEAADRAVIDWISDPALYNELEPYPEAAEAVHRLREYATLYAISSRPDCVRHTTWKRLIECFGRGVFADLHMVENKPKAARSLQCSVAFEDSDRECERYAKKGIHTFRVVRSYNGKTAIRSRFHQDVRSILEAAEAVAWRYPKVEVMLA